MAVTTMTLIGKQTVGSGGASSVTFSNIPQTYTDLKVVMSARSNGINNNGNQVVWLRLNNATDNTGISGKIVYGTGSSAGSVNEFDNFVPTTNETSNTFGNGEIYIPNYRSSNNKSISSDTTTENNATGIYQGLMAQLVTDTNPITSLTLVIQGGVNFSEFSTFYLYGISSNTSTQNTTTPYALGGDVITTDGTYWYHAFKYSGTFTPLKGINADILCVAGGGGGGGDIGGGGGAGGLSWQSGRSLTANTGLTVTVGAGGAGAPVASTAGSGTNSVIATITSNGGGAGGGGGGNGSTGGSGGGDGRSGVGYAATQTNTGGATGYGNAGGAFIGGSGGQAANGGGGGAGAAGTNGTTGAGGAGGVGLSGTTIAALDVIGVATGTGQLSSGHYYYAGGGGGAGWFSSTNGSGGLGGGGAAAATAVAGTVNTGGGGGGGPRTTSSSSSGVAGANGGSGIVIVRYAI